jgi:hypothetical protein
MINAPFPFHFKRAGFIQSKKTANVKPRADIRKPTESSRAGFPTVEIKIKHTGIYIRCRPSGNVHLMSAKR